MTDTLDLFSPANLAASVEIPAAPVLIPHNKWPFPGMSPEDSARASLARTSEYTAVIAATIKRHGSWATQSQVLALVPADWRTLLGKFAHGHLSDWQAKQHGIIAKYVHHDDGGFHFEYEPIDEYGSAERRITA